MGQRGHRPHPQEGEVMLRFPGFFPRPGRAPQLFCCQRRRDGLSLPRGGSWSAPWDLGGDLQVGAVGLEPGEGPRVHCLV